MDQVDLPVGSNPPPLRFPHFPTRQQAFVWRNLDFVSTDRLAEVLETTRENVETMVREMGLTAPSDVSENWIKRSYNTILRANWHLLPYEQLLVLLGWNAERLLFVLKEDDFMWSKLGLLKPRAEWLRFSPLTDEERRKTAQIRDEINRHFPRLSEPSVARPFDFLKALKEPEPIARQSWMAADDGEITPGTGWSLLFPKEPRRVRTFAQRFVQDCKNRWGMQMGLREGVDGQAQRTIRLEIATDTALRAESHVVEVDEQNIVVRAVDEIGLLRGLQWMERVMDKRGGPHLRKGLVRRPTRFDLRFIYPFDAPYADPFMASDDEICSDGLLERYSKLGINGIWLQAILYKLCPWEIEPELSKGYEKRIAAMRRLTERAADHGIGVFLYLGEPRGMLLDFYAKHPEYQSGVEEPGRGMGTFCTSYPPVLKRLRDATAWVFHQVPELAGVFTITMSENPSHCYSFHCYPVEAHPGIPATPSCPRCSQRKPEEIIAEINRTIAEGVHGVKPEARVIAWTWAWDVPEFKLHLDHLHPAVINLLPPEVDIMSTSEENLHTRIGGIDYSVYDYTISQIGPSERSRSVWNQAHECGMKTVAKIQVNNSWECSAIPYLPALESVGQHLDHLLSTPVSGLMLSWTLGGYPSLALDYAAGYYWGDRPGVDAVAKIKVFARETFGSGASEKMAEALHAFSAAFRNFPFCMGAAYLAPHNFGPMNLLYETKTGYQATMVGYPYDHLESWKGVYPLDVFEGQFQRLSETWIVGLRQLAEIQVGLPSDKQAALEDLRHVSLAAWLHFRSAYLQIGFVRLRDGLEGEKDPVVRRRSVEQIVQILDEEIDLARQMHDLVRRDSRIGFEPTQHYCYSPQLLMEKVINCEYLRRIFVGEEAAR